MLWKTVVVVACFLLKECSPLQCNSLQWKYISPFWLLWLALQQEQNWSQTPGLEAGNLKTHSGSMHPTPFSGYWTRRPVLRCSAEWCPDGTGFLKINVIRSKDGAHSVRRHLHSFSFYTSLSMNQKYWLHKWDTVKNTVLRVMVEEGGLGWGEGNISIIKSNLGKQKTQQKERSWS